MSEPRPRYPDTVTELAGFPYASYHEFQLAYKRGEVGLAIDGPAAMQLMGHQSRGGGSGRALLFSALAWGQFLVGVVAAVLAWPFLGWAGLSLILVSFIASVVSRPWMGKTAASVMGVLGLIGIMTRTSWLQWVGGVWVVEYFYMVGIYRFAIAQYRSDLLKDEKLLTRSLIPPSQADLIQRDGTRIRVSMRESEAP